MKRMKLLFTLAIPVFLSQSLQAQTSSRLIAEAHWLNNGVFFEQSDSSAYTYSATRGGDLTHTMKHDNSVNWRYNNVLGMYDYNTNSIQEFDSLNNIHSTTWLNWNSTTSLWVPTQRYIYSYKTTNNLMTSAVHQLWNSTASTWDNQFKDSFTYNTNNKLLFEQHMMWNFGSFTPYSDKTYYYDLSDNLLNVLEKEVFTGSPVYTHQHAYTYSSTFQMLTKTYSFSSTGTLVGFEPKTKITNTYDNVTGNRTYMQFDHWDNAVGMRKWVPDTLHIYTSFSGNQPQVERVQLYSNIGSGSFRDTLLYSYTYNSYNQLTAMVAKSWHPGVTWEYAFGDPKANYYYGPFTVVSSVKAVSNVGGDANIYPVPAQNTLHIDLNWDAPQTATIAIYDMQGRIALQWETPMAAQYKGGININTLAAGNYVVKINGKDGSIVKQIVVAN
jgi:hypothetical protein